MSEFREFNPDEDKPARMTETSEIGKEKKSGFLEKFLKGSRKEIALGLGALIISLSGGALAKENPREKDTFDELDTETEALKTTKEDVTQAQKSFERDLEIFVANPQVRENIKQALAETLGKLVSLDEQIGAIIYFQEQLDARKLQKPVDISGRVATIERAQKSSKEMVRGADGFEIFLDSKVSFVEAVKDLAQEIHDGQAIKYNGLNFSRKGSDLFFEGKKITEQSRPQIIDAYKNVQARMKAELGVNL
ncbi:MAG: hypothetical protein HZC05_03690 [Candidatus Magasanikbacteria bacterium]|nr:hypothetical protein [Candidatus Magasanikbacteria bacterium]